MEISLDSEQQKQSKIEKYEREINKLIEKHNGRLFIVKHERSVGSDDVDYSKDYSMEGSYYMGSKSHHRQRCDEPIFRISIKPRKSCNDHTCFLQDIQTYPHTKAISQSFSE